MKDEHPLNKVVENEQFRQQVEAIMLVCKDLTADINSTAICVNAVQHLNDLIEKYKTNE